MGETADALRLARESAAQRRPEEARERSPSPAVDREIARTLALDAERPADPPTRAPAPAPPPPEREPEPETAEARALKREGADEFRPARIALADPHNPVTQHYRQLALRLRDEAEERHCRSIVVTSAQSGEGKTTTSCNLAVQLGRLHQNSRVVLVDLDLRRPSVDRALGAAPHLTVEAVLRGDARAATAILETDVPGLSVLAQAHPATDPEWLLASAGLETMVRELEQEFDWVVIDTPPVLAAADAQIILRHAAGAIFVTRAGAAPVSSIRRAIGRLPSSKIIGSFLNWSRKGPEEASYYEYAPRPEDVAAREDVREPADGE